MKWYKHIADSLDDPFVFDLIDRMGGDGYLCFFGILEIYAREFQPEVDWKLRVSLKYLSRKLQLSRQKIAKFLEIASEKKWKVIEIEDGEIEIHVPKFLDFIDETTIKKMREHDKKLRKYSGDIPESVRTKEEEEEEEDISVHESVPPKPPTAKPEKISYAENVRLTPDEYQALSGRYGQEDTDRLIEILDNYKGSKGKAYKSDYRAILSWCVSRLEEEKTKQGGGKRIPRAFKSLMDLPDDMEVPKL